MGGGQGEVVAMTSVSLTLGTRIPPAALGSDRQRCVLNVASARIAEYLRLDQDHAGDGSFLKFHGAARITAALAL